MDPQQLKKIMVPALAIAGVVVLVGLIISFGGGPADEQNAGGNAKNLRQNAPQNTPSTDDPLKVPADSGMTAELPNLEAPEWQPIGSAGLKKWDVVVGSRLEASPANEVEVHYTGWLTNGNVFDSSWRRNEPIAFSLRGVIAGWTQGIPGMRVGGIRRLYIPAPLAYGSEQKGNSIPPNSTLVFEVKLLRIVK